MEKQKEKQKAKDEKAEAKMLKKNQQALGDENVVIAQTECIQILKYGARKGQPCCNKTTNGQFCTRHFNMQTNT
jgi:hypothetical protein